MPQGLSNTKTAEKLINQLNNDTAQLDPQGKEAPQGNSASADTWEAPKPLESTVSAPPFPIHCLPVPLRDYAKTVAEHTQTPIDMVALGTVQIT